MPSLPTLEDWNETRDSLHAAAQVVGRVRKTFVPPQPNALHLPLFVTRTGLTTGPMRKDGETHEVNLNLVDSTLHVSFESAPIMPLTIANLRRVEEKAAQVAGKFLTNMDAPTSQLKIDPVISAGYAGALYRIYSSIARFRARLLGRMTPVVVWPHHFDLSFLYFVGDGSDEHQDRHMNFGFAPFSATIERPYVYAYAWPMPKGIMKQSLPEPAQWFDGDWRGVIMEYDTLVTESDPEYVIENVLAGIFTLFRDAMLNGQ
jgi:hypothetical protein